MMINKPLIRLYFLGAGGIGAAPIDSHHLKPNVGVGVMYSILRTPPRFTVTFVAKHKGSGNKIPSKKKLKINLSQTYLLWNPHRWLNIRSHRWHLRLPQSMCWSKPADLAPFTPARLWRSTLGTIGGLPSKYWSREGGKIYHQKGNKVVMGFDGIWCLFPGGYGFFQGESLVPDQSQEPTRKCCRLEAAWHVATILITRLTTSDAMKAWGGNWDYQRWSALQQVIVCKPPRC